MSNALSPANGASALSPANGADAFGPANGAAVPGQAGELNVSGHLMTLEPGLFCIVQLPAKQDDAATGLPGVRISLPPGALGRPEAVQFGGFRSDGWLSASGDATLIRVSDHAAQILVTIYKSGAADSAAPNLQVMRLLDPDAATHATPPPQANAPPPAEAVQPAPRPQDLVAHIQTRGDVGAMLGEWLGEPGSKRWIEGFAVAPTQAIAVADIEYQAVLGRGWLSPWAAGGQFCGSRGMALPVLGLRVRLRNVAEQEYECLCSATFVDGTKIGPVAAGQACEAESLAPLEAFQITISQRNGAAQSAATANSPAPEMAAPQRQASPKSAPAKPVPAAASKAATTSRRRS